MADKPDGKPAGASQRVTFTRPAAERIASVVRRVEAGNRNSNALAFGPPNDGSLPLSLRVATFTGTWAIATDKTVTLKYVTSTPNTLVATNLFFEWPGTATYDCAVGKDGTAWHLLAVPIKTASVTYLSGVSVAASLNTSNCTITVTQTNTTTSASFTQFKV